MKGLFSKDFAHLLEEEYILIKKGQVINCRSNIVKISDDKEVLIKGLENYIIIDSNEGLLIYPEKIICGCRNRVKLGSPLAGCFFGHLGQ